MSSISYNNNNNNSEPTLPHVRGPGQSERGVLSFSHAVSPVYFRPDSSPGATDEFVVCVANETFRRGGLLGRGNFKSVFSLVGPNQASCEYVEAQTDLSALPEFEREKQLDEWRLQSYLARTCNAGCIVSSVAIALEKQAPKKLVLRQIFPRMESDLIAPIKNAVLSDKEKIAICLRVASGIAAMHRMDFIHEDIKPENILLNVKKKAFLTDFGLAKSVSEFLGSDTVSGSPCYVSPDKLRRVASRRFKTYQDKKPATLEQRIKAWAEALENRGKVLRRLKELHEEFQQQVPVEEDLSLYHGDLEELVKGMDLIAEKRQKLNMELSDIDERISEIKLAVVELEERNQELNHMAKGGDVWSLGVILFAMVTGKLPRWLPEGTNDPQRIVNAVGSLKQNVVDFCINGAKRKTKDNSTSKGLLEIAHLCFTVDPSQRPAIETIRELLGKI